MQSALQIRNTFRAGRLLLPTTKSRLERLQQFFGLVQKNFDQLLIDDFVDRLAHHGGLTARDLLGHRCNKTFDLATQCLPSGNLAAWIVYR